MVGDAVHDAEQIRAWDPAADPVCDFYTKHPYPPPVENLDRARDEWLEENRRRAEYHLFWPRRVYRADLDILVSGCGTWQAAKYALCWPGARVVGIDVSTTSLDHTNRLKRRYDLSNLETLQLPIEDVTVVGRAFDLIVCTGVLHHLVDPEAGLRALRSVLRGDGALYLMVYAPYGRTGLYMLQDYCRRLGVGASARDMYDLASVLRALPQGHPLVALLRGSRDAQSADALADALLNPRDRSYSVPQLFDAIGHAGLTFGRWHRQAPYFPQCGAIAETPHARRLAALPDRERYAAMELWRGTMASHSVIAYHSDAEHDAGAEIRLDDERWASCVPIRLPHTLCIQDRLPAGAAGVLLNRSHTSHDLVLPVDTQEKRIFDAIDGRRTIAEIADHADRCQLSRALEFFQKLFWFDQIVLDASMAR